ncbi:MAG: epoxyqueuosine reductase [candidate division Zixibacteria bacterium]|nr:epoxyqueuosine reductase [candidate division Zixibacteria bacterium]
MSDQENNYNVLKALALSQGASHFGVADITDERKKFDEEIRKEAESMPYAIVIAVKLSMAVLNTVEDYPTKIYKTHYRAANALLDNIAFRLSDTIGDMGYRSIPIAASFIINWEKQTAHVSHKGLAELAGIGWRGRNNLLVTPEYGPSVRLVSILTDIPLKTDEPLAFGCDECIECLDHCPAGAIQENPKDFDHIGCFNQLHAFTKHKNFGQYLCGICIKHCLKCYG